MRRRRVILCAVTGLSLVGACRRGFDAYEDACLPISCIGDQLLDCKGVYTCEYGCAMDAPPHCLALAPSNGLSADLLAGVTEPLVGASLRFDTTTGAIVGDQGVVRGEGSGVSGGIGFFVIDEMAVFAAASISVPANTTWTAVGSNALVLFAATSLIVDGTIDVGGNGEAAGPHGTQGGTGGPRTSCEGTDGLFKFSITAGAGAGGGGGATAGGVGGATAADGAGSTLGGVGGVACAIPSTSPLRGGHGGGAGGTEAGVIMGGAGGGGGGAVALVAMSGIVIDGAVAAPGAGGETIPGGTGGGGGGGGGAVFLESPTVVVRGAVTANGGGGGPASNATAVAVAGERGHPRDGNAALGGSFGGNGGAASGAPTNGGTATGGGGGGGAMGVSGIRSLAPTVGTATLSPVPAMSPATLK